MPPNTIDIVASMRLSPLYGKNGLFTRMADGISAFAQGAPAFGADDIRRAFPRSMTAKVLARLYANEKTEWLDSIGEDDASVARAAAAFKGVVDTAVATAMNRGDSGDRGESLKEVGTLVVLARLSQTNEFQLVLGPVSDKLGKIVRVVASPGFRASIRTVEDAVRGQDIRGELAAIRDRMGELSGRSADVISPRIMEGARVGADAVARMVPAGTSLRVSPDEVVRIIEEFVVPEYTRRLETDGITANLEPSWLVLFGRNVATMGTIALNKETFRTSRAAVLAFGKCNVDLSRLAPFREDWRRILVRARDMWLALRSFNTVEETDQPAAPDRTSMRDKIHEWFIRGTNGQVEVLENQRRYATAPDKRIDEVKQQVDEEIGSAAAAYYAYTQRKSSEKPNQEKAGNAGGAFYRLMLMYALKVEERSERAIVDEIKGELDNWWPGWAGVVGNFKNWPPDGVVEGLIDDLEIRGRRTNGMSKSHYRLLFNLTYREMEAQVKNGINTRINKECNKPEDNKVCDAFNAVLGAIGTDNLVLANPKAVERLFGGAVHETSSIGLAQSVLSRVILDIEEGEEIDEDRLNSMARDLILNIAMYGESKGGPYGKWGRLDNVPGMQDDPNVLKNERENRQKAEQAAVNAPTWGKPETIIFGSAILWFLARGASGIAVF